MRPPSFKMELPPDHNHRDIKPLLPPPTMPHHHHDPPIEVNELPPAKFKASVKAAADSDETEYSTSFADTASTNDNNSSALSDTEVESKLHSDTNGFSSSFDEFGGAFRVRKKKLTSHWRNFIRPVMWRCKWAELKIKQFESQALQYTKTIAAYDQTKHLANQSIPEGFTSRSMPFTCQGHHSKLMKRRKRVRVEDTTDAKLYMSKHILFSYHESRKSDPDGASITEDFDDPVLTGQKATSQEEGGFEEHSKWSFVEDKDDNEMEQILGKIEIAQTRVHKLKSQLDLLISENQNVAVANAQTSTVRSPTFSTCNNGGGSCDNAVSSYAHAQPFHIPDIIESTVALPSSLHVTHHHSQVADSSENIVDNMVVHSNQGGEAEKHSLRNCQQQQVVVIVKQEGDKSEEDEEEEEEEEGEEEEESAHPGIGIGQEQSSMISSLASGFQIPKNKRKRGERKACTGNWSRQCPGEPDTS
ncbi:hypothetical protein L2E82_04595 [Cichorium intybus]|uniref:Uncharacterized protein n=1 Tax=Cichorium intybus TaxID=13427 RepID=A0ACB9H5S1_CICIN|nr:hypothetical protein L2E82_04595 [Cichorium intybus]